MTAIKKIVSISLLPLTLVSCALQFSNDPAAAKSKLEENGYTVKLYTQEEYEKLETAETFDSDLALNYHLTAFNEAEKNYLFAWYFTSIESAEFWQRFNESNFASLNTFGDGVRFTSGQMNNVIWTGTNDAAKLAGYTFF